MLRYGIIVVIVLCVWLLFYIMLGDKLSAGELVFVAAVAALLVWAAKAVWNHLRGKGMKHE